MSHVDVLYKVAQKTAKVHFFLFFFSSHLNTRNDSLGSCYHDLICIFIIHRFIVDGFSLNHIQRRIRFFSFARQSIFIIFFVTIFNITLHFIIKKDLFKQSYQKLHTGISSFISAKAWFALFNSS